MDTAVNPLQCTGKRSHVNRRPIRYETKAVSCKVAVIRFVEQRNGEKFVAEYGILVIFQQNDGILAGADFLENDALYTEFS